MALTTSSALKQFIEQQGLSLSVYQDQAPDGTLLITPNTAAGLPSPYVTVDEALPVIPDQLEDGVATTVKEHVTVHVWMAWKNLLAPNTPRMEDPALAGKIAKALHGSRLLTSGSGAPPTTVYGVLVHSIGPRILERDENVVHVPIWVEVWRNL